MNDRLLERLTWAGMGLLVLSLPFTSFPLVARLTGSSMVAPLALLPMGAMLVFWLLPYFARRGTLPPQALPLGAFLLAVVAGCAAAFFLPIPPLKGQAILHQEIEALATLAVGAGFYLLASAWINSANRLVFVLKLINVSGMMIILWSLAQAAVFERMGGYPAWFWDLQGQFSSSMLLFPRRVTGFAFEPSWLAHQLNMLYLPYWLAAAASGYSAHRFQLGRIRFEHLLLIGGAAALFLSVSRIGWLSFLAMLAVLILALNLRFVGWAQKSLLRRHTQPSWRQQAIRRWFFAASLLALLILYIGLMLGAAYALSRIDPRMARLFDFSTIREYSFVYYANQLVFAERIVFWQAGWEVFNDFPLLGVGLGNAGFFFPEKLSAFSWGLTEIRTLMYQWSTLPNTKSLWVRLLAETGIVGFALFVSWLSVLWVSARYLLRRLVRLSTAMGLAGVFVLAGFLVEGFSIDTFALPYYWIAFGLLTAACGIARRSDQPAVIDDHRSD